MTAHISNEANSVPVDFSDSWLLSDVSQPYSADELIEAVDEFLESEIIERLMDGEKLFWSLEGHYLFDGEPLDSLYADAIDGLIEDGVLVDITAAIVECDIMISLKQRGEHLIPIKLRNQPTLN